MRNIEVSTAVFAAIWAARAAGEETENSILERVLGVNTRAKPISTPSTPQKAKAMPYQKIRWVDDVVESLKNLGGGAYYAEIYREVRRLRTAAGRSIPKTFEEVVRKEIETHSSDSDAFTHRENYFHAPQGKGAGYWALR